jgi:hypothetical protein
MRSNVKSGYAEYFKCKRMLLAKVDSYADKPSVFELLKYYKEIDETDLFPSKKDDDLEIN